MTLAVSINSSTTRQRIPEVLNRRTNVGALVVGGDHPGLGIVRSLGRRGIPVYVVDDQYSISKFSRYPTRVLQVDNLLDEERTVETILKIGRRFDLKDWVLYPTRDETVAAFSRHAARLGEYFRVTTPAWDTIRWAWDKKNTYDLAEKLGIPAPKTWNPKTAEELELLRNKLPLALKPAVKENFFYATGAKAWRADTLEELKAIYHRAQKQIKPEEILIQEIIPGDGRQQYSFCAFVRGGEIHSSLVARRVRQHPREFGRAATYVETTDLPEIEGLSAEFLKAIDFYGVVELEFKHDNRDGKYKLLDVNARIWGFHILGAAAGVDFAYMLFADQLGMQIEKVRARAGVGWLRLITDIPTALTQISQGHVTLKSYVDSVKRTRVESVFAAEDPLPSLAEFLMLPYLVTKKYML
jgi:D-aspartate ligase